MHLKLGIRNKVNLRKNRGPLVEAKQHIRLLNQTFISYLLSAQGE